MFWIGQSEDTIPKEEINSTLAYKYWPIVGITVGLPLFLTLVSIMPRVRVDRAGLR